MSYDTNPELTYVDPPAGMKRRDLRRAIEAEGARIAAFQVEHRAELRQPDMPPAMPRRALGAWEEVKRAERKSLRREHNRATQDVQQIGALVIAGLVAAAAGTYWFVNRDTEPAAAPAGPRVVASSAAPVTVRMTSTPTEDAVTAARKWFGATCPSTIDAPQPQRYTDHLNDMTPAAQADVRAVTAQPIEWTCTDMRVTPEDGAGAAEVIVYLEALRRISGTNTAYPVLETRRMELAGGRWLVGPKLAAN